MIMDDKYNVESFKSVIEFMSNRELKKKRLIKGLLCLKMLETTGLDAHSKSQVCSHLVLSTVITQQC